MGNSASSSGRGHHDDTVDFGSLAPQGVYTGPRDWNQAVVSQLIVARKLAPFYRPLEEYEESWDDDQILAARKELPDLDAAETLTRIEAAHAPPPPRASHIKRPGFQKDPVRPEAAIYRGAVECPICFLYYPPNINHSRCCDQAICTECFVQIKRNEPTTTHLVSEPAACPYCVQDNFGVVYTPPPWRAGIGSEGSSNSPWDSPRGSQQSIETSSPPPTHKRRQKSFSADSPDVVTTDQIRPDWEQKLAAVRAAVTRRANRRIIMRQVGDRLIPVGVTSGRVHPLSPEEAANAEAAEGGGSRRSRRRQQPQAGQGYEQFMGMGGQDLEELMLMEAMRLSLIDHEEQQRKQAEEEKKKKATAAGDTSDADASSETQAAPGPGPSTLEAQSSNQMPSLSSSPSSLAPVSSSPSEIQGHKRKSWSLSRGRTPPPPANESDEGWRTSNPPAFSTLNAALASASTASAFLGASSGQNSTGASLHDSNGNTGEQSSIPTITVEGDDSNDASRSVLPTKDIDRSATNPFISPLEMEALHDSLSESSTTRTGGYGDRNTSDSSSTHASSR